MKGIILYTSKYGSTKRYAEWLAEETGFDCVETKKAKLEAVKQYDTILLGGGIYASGIAGLPFLKKNMAQLREKKVIVFCDGASPYEERAFQQIVAHNLKDSLSVQSCFWSPASSKAFSQISQSSGFFFATAFWSILQSVLSARDMASGSQAPRQ